MSSKGILLFCYNNEILCYAKQSIIASILAKKYLNGVSVSIVTDENTLNYFDNNISENLVNYCFDNIIVKENDNKEHRRSYKQFSDYYTQEVEYKNGQRHNAYYLTPYDETIVIDTDYLIFSNKLNNLWNSSKDIHINDITEPVSRINTFAKGNEQKKLVKEGTIFETWATVFYFKKTNFSRFYFDLVNHIRNNWNYYQLVYDLSSKTIRSDHTFSVAKHIINNLNENNLNIIDGFNTGILRAATQYDKLYDVLNNGIILESLTEKNEKYFLRIKDMDLHFYNKFHLENFFEKFLERYWYGS